MGGPSAEYEVSVNSGVEILAAIDKSVYEVRAVIVSRNKELYSCDIDNGPIPSAEELAAPENHPRMQGPFSFAASAHLWKECDAAFLALHGSFGEDGIIQGYLESIGIPYTGSGVCASAVAMDKVISKFLFLQNGFSVPPYLLYGKRHSTITADYIVEALGLPCFVKCPQSGSSKLMGCATTVDELDALLEEFSDQATEILIEQTISGTEFTCGVLEDTNGIPFALPPIEIRPKERFFSYNAKYTVGASEELVPAPQSKKMIGRIQQIALDAHLLFNCIGISRTDMILHDDRLYVLETNTLPGMTANSLIPKSFAATGGSFAGLIDLLINRALSRRAAENL